MRIIFIHGNGGTNWSSGWAPWLKQELDKLGHDTVFQTFPDSVLARKEYWLPFLHDQLKADKHTLLIGWSSGAVAAMRYAEKYAIWGSILVAPCYTDLGIESEKISGWYDQPWNWARIKANQKQIGLLYSLNDEFIPLVEFQHIKDQLTPNQVVEFENNGHFIKQDTFPELVRTVQQITKL